jgi:hypothetical protein
VERKTKSHGKARAWRGSNPGLEGVDTVDVFVLDKSYENMIEESFTRMFVKRVFSSVLFRRGIFDEYSQ